MAEKAKGYDIFFDQKSSILRFRFWGFWDAVLSERFKAELQKKVGEIRAKQQEWYVLADLREYSAQSQAVQKSLREAMSFLKEKGMKKTARVVNRTLTQLQIDRLSQEQGLTEYAFFRSEDEAIRWLLSE
jgi:hypothetical protein